MIKTVLQQYWRVVIGALLAAGLLFLALSGYLAPVIHAVSTPLVTVQTWVATRYYTLIRPSADATQLVQENESLRSDNARLRNQILSLQEQQKDAPALYSLLKIARTTSDSSYIAALVIGRDPSPFLRYLFINQGSDAGLRRGMPVTTDQGLAGRIVSVSAEAAQVQLITDTSSAVNVQLPKGGNAVLTGSVTGDITLEMIPQEAQVSPNDLVITSGLGGSYPPNLVVGRVVGVRKEQTALFQSAAVQPAVQFGNIRWVLVITDFKPVDLTPLLPAVQP